MATASLRVPTGSHPSFPTCGKCGLSLPLREDAKGPKQAVNCVGCGAEFQASIATDAPPELLANILLAIGGGFPPAVKPTAPRHKRSTAVVREARTLAKPPAPTTASRVIDAALDDRPSMTVEPVAEPLLHESGPRGATPYNAKLVEQVRAEFEASNSQVDAMVRAVERGEPLEIGESEAIARRSLVQATADLDLFIRLGVHPTEEGYPGRHALQVATMACAIGARLGWDRETLVQLGVGCLIHDLGMLKVPDKAFLQDQILDEESFSRVAAHPLHTFDLIEEHLDTTPLVTRMVAYQIHERCDGTGYPRARKAPLIHEAAKVAAVADVFVALISPRPYRQPLLPYQAMEHLIRAAGGGSFDSNAVRALLRTVSLYPIGSCLELADGRVGRVLRSNPDSYTRPIIEAWRPRELEAPAEIVDLFLDTDVKVRRPLASLSG